MSDQYEGDVREIIDKSNIEHSTSILALITVLIDKGVFTEDEFVRQRVRSGANIDQIWQQKRDQQFKDLEDTDPKMAKILKFLMGE